MHYIGCLTQCTCIPGLMSYMMCILQHSDSGGAVYRPDLRMRLASQLVTTAGASQPMQMNCCNACVFIKLEVVAMMQAIFIQSCELWIRGSYHDTGYIHTVMWAINLGTIPHTCKLGSAPPPFTPHSRVICSKFQLCNYASASCGHSELILIVLKSSYSV